MSRQEIDQLINRPDPSSSQDQASDSIHNLNKQLQDFQHRFKGYHSQKPFSDSDSDQEKTLSRPPPIQPKQSKAKEEQSRLSQIQEQIKWKDPEIQQLLKLEGEGPKDKKIKQLAQKVKLLSINLEKERNGNIKKKQELNSTTNTSYPVDLKKSMRPSEDGDLKGKLAQSQKQVMEMRLKNQNMKNQLNKALRVISKEIGEDVNIDDILSQENSWKGRQQKIEYLKGKVKELEGRLNSTGVDVSHMSGFTMMSTQKTTRQQTTLNGLSDNRRKQMQNLKIQIQAVKSENQILHGKVKALASRKGTLETEVKEIKGEYQKKEKLFKEKSENDDKYILLLKSENQKLKREKEDKVVTKLVYKNSDNGEVVEAKKEIERLKGLVSKKEIENKQLMEKVEVGKQKEQPKSREVRPPSTDKTKKVIQKKIQELQKQYMEQDKVQQSITPEEQQAIYKQWKEQKLKAGK